ncbi:DUF7521 family protein [Halorientalis regularis]|uniref:Uncharacterized protein n=2 Tax=Halorientalis regularis TaxID=660518 RepID=A0A1G7F719_9EURY|nr:hypothetical protein [Halorientalis regularis]SDE71606.1 hypothetical protein SAMN05216218_10151 [Halorientalis regularis]
MIELYPLVHLPTVITALKTVTLVLGAMITFFSYKAFRRTGARPLGLLALGFAVVTLGSLLAGVFDLGLSLPREYAIIAETGLTALGFGVIVYSLYAR